MSPVPAAAVLAALAAVALIADRAWVVAAIAAGLLVLCLRAPRGRRRLYLAGTLLSALSVFLLSPLVSHVGTHVIWAGPKVPVIGYLDVTSEEIAAAAPSAEHHTITSPYGHDGFLIETDQVGRILRRVVGHPAKARDIG